MQPDDDSYQAILTDYMTPADDNGFSDVTMASIAARQKYLQRLRFTFLAAGSFFGGIIAATQIGTVLELIVRITIPTDMLTLAIVAVLFAFIVWATLDSKIEGTF